MAATSPQPAGAQGQRRGWLDRIPPFPQQIETLSKWAKIAGAVLSGLGALVALISGFLAPEFLVEYEIMETMPTGAFVRGFGASAASNASPEEAAILRLRISNEGKKSEIKKVEVTVKGGIQRLFFVIDRYGRGFETTPQVPSGQLSELKITVGDMGPASETTVFVGGEFSLLFDPAIVARSANAGLADVRRSRSVSGAKLFVADNLEWIAAFVFLVFSIVLLSSLDRRH